MSSLRSLLIPPMIPPTSCMGGLGRGEGVLWGRILGRNWDESLKSFPPCYSQSSLQLCLEISSYFFKLTQPLIVSTVQLYCTLERRKEENLIENHTPRPMVKKSMQKPQVWELSRSFPETSTKFYVHEFGFCTGILLIKSCETYCSKFSYLLVAILGGQCSGRPLPDEHRWWDGQSTGTTGETVSGDYSYYS